jgi:thimet oligopeptidase
LLIGLGLVASSIVPVAAQVPPDSPVADALKRADAAVAAIVAIPDDKRNFDNTLGAIDDLVVRLRQDTEYMRFMAFVSTDTAEREAGQRAEEHVQNWYTELNKREDLYRAVKAYAATNPKLDGEQKRLLEFTLRDFRRAGMELPPEKRAELKRIELERNKVALDFDKNIRDDETRVPLTPEELKGVPDSVLANIPRSGELYLAGLDAPTYVAIQTYCEIEPTRQKLYVAFKRKGGRQNIVLLEKMIKLRADAARLLGYPSTADYETEIRMAKNAAAVAKFYEDLRPIIRRKAQLDFDEFAAAKRAHMGNPDAKLQAWDQFFYEEWLLKHKYAVDSQKVQEYFPMQRVVDGLLAVTSALYGIEYKDVTSQAASLGIRLWHPDVRLFEVRDKSSGDVLGAFGFDPFPRPNKYGHFANFGVWPRKVWSDGKVSKPFCVMVCNFSPPSGDKPSLLKHEEVVTFFHEFGHCLHSLLTQTRSAQFSGTATALDFVELPSQMFENWVWDREVLRTFAKHYKTGEPLPDDLLAAMLKARQFASGMKAERQVFYGLVDQRYHCDPEGKVNTTKVGADTMAEAELFPPVPATYFQAGFGHLSGYVAGYYGYLWSLVYAQDMATPFKEKGFLNPDLGMKYRNVVLARGGAVEELNMIREFLGREPRMEPFLEHLGLSK